MTNDRSIPVHAAAILDDGRRDIDALLRTLVQAQRAAGRRVRGLLMAPHDGGAGCARTMVLVDLHTHDEYLVSQPLGGASNACRADPQGFARASQVLKRAVDEAPDLLISNRFGSLEALGGGFCAELLEAMSHGVPVLTAVSSARLEAWRAFTGGVAAELPADLAAIEAWLDSTRQTTAPTA